MMDYRISYVRTWSLLCMRIHTRVEHKSSQQFCLGKTLTNFSCATDGVRTLRHWILNLTLYQLSHPITLHYQYSCIISPEYMPQSPKVYSFDVINTHTHTHTTHTQQTHNTHTHTHSIEFELHKIRIYWETRSFSFIFLTQKQLVHWLRQPLI